MSEPDSASRIFAARFGVAAPPFGRSDRQRAVVRSAARMIIFLE